jgi:hypothetical protein
MNRLEQAEERLLGIEDKVEELSHSDSNKEKNKHNQTTTKKINITTTFKNS